MKIPRIMLAGTGEKMQYLAHDFNDNTIRFILHYPDIVRSDLLCAAAKALADSVSILHSSFLAGNLTAYWHVNQTYEENDYFTLIEVEDDPMEPAIRAALRAIDPADRVQFHCTLVQGRGESVLTLTLSHLCVDGGDGKYLLKKLVEGYNLLAASGTAALLAVKNGNRTAEQVYENLNSKEILSLLKNPISSVKTSFPFPTEDAGELHMVGVKIPRAVMAAARLRAKECGATVNDVLLAACYRGYGALPEADASAPLSVMSMMDLRRHCTNGESEGLCNMSGTLPTTLNEGVQGSFETTLKQVAEQTRAAKNNPLAGLEGMPLIHYATRTTPLWLILKVSEKVYGSFSIGLTNLGNLSGDELTLADIAPDDGVFGGPLKKKPGMQISAISLDGSCALSVFGEYTETDGALLQRMLDNMAGEIAEYAADTP